MMKRNVDDIDKLFRDGLNPEDNHFTFPEGEWLKMKQRLNRYDQRKKGIFWLIRLGSVAALLMLFFILRNGFIDDRQQVVQHTEVQQKDQSSANNNSKKQQQPETLDERENQPRISPENNTSANNMAGQASTALAPNRKLNNKPSALDHTEVSQVKRLEKKDSLIKENFEIEKNTIIEPAFISTEEKTAIAETGKAVEEKPSTAKEPVLGSIEQTSIEPAVERSVHKMILSVMAAPAYNGVDNLNNGSMGNDFGLLVSYEIAKNWTLSTGGIYAKKLYDTGFKSYQPKNNIWKEYYPDNVNADCRVLDIPLNFSYTFLKGKNRSISAGSGISSYIMLRENYHFSYAETDPENPLSYKVVNENRHWLSVLNFQATIEQHLSKKLSISLQPYLKLPLGPVGFAGVKLQSLGMAANLNWNFTL